MGVSVLDIFEIMLLGILLLSYKRNILNWVIKVNKSYDTIRWTNQKREATENVNSWARFIYNMDSCVIDILCVVSFFNLIKITWKLLVVWIRQIFFTWTLKQLYRAFRDLSLAKSWQCWELEKWMKCFSVLFNFRAEHRS